MLIWVLEDESCVRTSRQRRYSWINVDYKFDRSIKMDLGTMGKFLIGMIIFGLIDRAIAQRCGVSPPSNADDDEKYREDEENATDLKVEFVSERIVGGEEARPHAYPWMIALVRGNYVICGGALIDDQYVVTAAHCVQERPIASYYRVIVGAHNVYRGELYGVERVVAHPMFNKGSPRFSNDIAILRLNRRVNLSSSKKVGKICMPTSYLNGGRECVVTGWGRTSEGGRPSFNLLEVKVPIVDNEQCNSRAYYNGLIGPTMLCAGRKEGGKDTCQGDSGGPLVCQQPNGQWELHGVVSWGYGCARAFKPGVYARVSILKEWISSQMTAMRREARREARRLH